MWIDLGFRFFKGPFTSVVDWCCQVHLMLFMEGEIWCLIVLFLHPRKLTYPLNNDYFSREYIFQPLILRGHVSFQGSIHSLRIWNSSKISQDFGGRWEISINWRISGLLARTNFKPPPIRPGGSKHGVENNTKGAKEDWTQLPMELVIDISLSYL